MALGAAAVLVCGVGGCAGDVVVTPLPQASSTACGKVVAAFPETVGGMPRVSVSPDAAAGAWGDPAVIARCGAGALAPTTTECIDVDDVGWIPEPLSDGTRFTTFGTDPALEVLVPSRYDPAPLLLPAFDAAARALPPNGLRCR